MKIYNNKINRMNHNNRRLIKKTFNNNKFYNINHMDYKIKEILVI